MAKREPGAHEAREAAVLLGAAIVAEGARFVLQRPWPRVSARAAYLDSGVLLAIWCATLALVLLRKRLRWSAGTAWIATATAPLAMLLQGIVTRVAGDNWGLLYVPAAVALAVALESAFHYEDPVLAHFEHHDDPGTARRT